MNIGEILVWESTNVLLLIPVVIALVMLVRWIRGRAVFTESDWLFLFGHPREKVLSLHMWLRFAVLWVAVLLSASLRATSSYPLVSRHSLAVSFSPPCSLACCAEVVALRAAQDASSTPTLNLERNPCLLSTNCHHS